jgi:MFS family permease
LQIINSGSLGTFYAGRIIAGLGIGANTVLISIVTAKVVPNEIQGRLVAYFQLFFATGVMLAYWITYAISKHQKSATKQWQVALACSCLPQVLISLACSWSRRALEGWLRKARKTGKAREALKRTLGGDETEELQQDFDEILAGIAEEARIKEEFTFNFFCQLSAIVCSLQ